jgi:hypothetical protein
VDPARAPQRVAVTSRDGLSVNERFHRSRDFFVFEATSAGFRFLERRYLPDSPERGQPRFPPGRRAARGLSGHRFGFNGAARTALSDKGFAVIEGRGPIDAVLREFLTQKPASRDDP